MVVYAIVGSVSDIILKAASGDINRGKFFGTGGHNGLVIQTSLETSLISIDGTKVELKTYSGQSREGELDALKYCIQQFIGEGLTFDLYSDIPCEVNDGVYTPLDSQDWQDSALPNIFVELKTSVWKNSSIV